MLIDIGAGNDKRRQFDLLFDQIETTHFKRPGVTGMHSPISTI
ncbi:hypothetical protein [Paraburkholderia caribensis]|nr:hypothetical protein [Paraburkholderia caribensis]